MCFRALGVHTPQRPTEFLNHPIERRYKGRPLSDQYIVVSRPHSHRCGPLYNLAQAPTNTISLNRITDFLRYGEADPHRPAIAPP